MVLLQLKYLLELLRKRREINSLFRGFILSQYGQRCWKRRKTQFLPYIDINTYISGGSNCSCKYHVTCIGLQVSVVYYFTSSICTYPLTMFSLTPCKQIESHYGLKTSITLTLSCTWRYCILYCSIEMCIPNGLSRYVKRC